MPKVILHPEDPFVPRLLLLGCCLDMLLKYFCIMFFSHDVSPPLLLLLLLLLLSSRQLTATCSRARLCDVWGDWYICDWSRDKKNKKKQKRFLWFSTFFNKNAKSHYTLQRHGKWKRLFQLDWSPIDNMWKITENVTEMIKCCWTLQGMFLWGMRQNNN